MKKLETKRLILRKPYLKDLKDFHEFATLNNVGPTAGWLPHTSIKESKHVLKEHIKRQDIWFIELKENQKVIGTINLNVRDFYDAINGVVELGYAINSNYWHLGYASEAVKVLIKHSFNDLGIKKIVCGHAKDNHASKKIILNNGFTFTHIDDERIFENEMIDSVYMYELKVEDYGG